MSKVCMFTKSFPSYFSFVLFPSISGRQFEIDNLEHIKWMGRFIGRISAVSRSHHFKHRPTMDTKEHLLIPSQELQDSSLIPSGLHTAFLLFCSR